MGLGLVPALGSSASAAPVAHENGGSAGRPSGKQLVLKNVRLETGFEYDGEEVAATKTALFCVAVENGKITAITPNDPGAAAVDAKGWLMLPVFKDMHIHMDKTNYGGPWKGPGRRRWLINWPRRRSALCLPFFLAG